MLLRDEAPKLHDVTVHHGATLLITAQWAPGGSPSTYCMRHVACKVLAVAVKPNKLSDQIRSHHISYMAGQALRGHPHDAPRSTLAVTIFTYYCRRPTVCSVTIARPKRQQAHIWVTLQNLLPIQTRLLPFDVRI